MKRSKKTVIPFIVITILIVVVSIRLYLVNSNSQNYETYRQDVRPGDTIILGNLELTFGQVSEPIIEKSEDYPEDKIVIYKLPLKVKKINDEPFANKNKFAIYENYKTFINLANVVISSDSSTSDFFSVINAPEKGETVDFEVSTDFKLGKFYYYYDDYNVSQPAYIVIAGPQSPKGIPLYYYKLQNNT